MANGCGCERGLLRWVKPPYARTFYAACCVHDDDYDRGGTSADRLAADRRLLDNCLKIAARSAHPPLTKLRMSLTAHLYYLAVRLFGHFHFNYTK